MKSITQTLYLVFIIYTLATSSLTAQDNALNFNGTSSYVHCGNILSTNYTKEAWIYIRDLSKDNNIISGGVESQHAFWAPPIFDNMGNSLGNKLTAGHNSQWYQVQDPAPLNANTWYHVAATFDAASRTMKLYKNGILVATSTSVDDIGESKLTLVGAFYVGDHFFAGDMDNIRIWNVARTDAEIQLNKSITFTTAQPNLLVNYTCDQGTAGGNNSGITQLINTGYTDHHGTLVGFMLSGSTSNFITSSSPLPVELLNLKASPLSNYVKIAWQTTNEINNKGFQVERLNPMTQNWDILGFVKAQVKGFHYEFIDDAPLSMSYYRLRQIDHDGKEVLSKIVSAALNGSTKLKVYPNLVTDFLNIDSDVKGDFQIINMFGQSLINGYAAQKVDVSALPKGTYFVKVGTEQAKFVKQ